MQSQGTSKKPSNFEANAVSRRQSEDGKPKTKLAVSRARASQQAQLSLWSYALSFHPKVIVGAGVDWRKASASSSYLLGFSRSHARSSDRTAKKRTFCTRVCTKGNIRSRSVLTKKTKYDGCLGLGPLQANVGTCSGSVHS